MSATDPPTIMLSDPRLLGLDSRFVAEGWRVAKSWELGDAERAGVRAIVHAGDVLLPNDLLRTLPRLGLVACVGTGYDGVDVAWCRARGVEVTNGAGLNAADVADHAIGLVVAGWRNILSGDRLIRDGTWSANPRVPLSRSLCGRRLGVVGLGAIGRASAERAEAFGMEVAWWGPRAKPEAPWSRHASLLDLAGWSDILLVACPANAENRGLISRAVIEAVGPQGMIVNVARGSVLDEDALIAALQEGRLGRAGLDVFAEEPTSPQRWADVPNTVLTPHCAGGTFDILPRLVDQTVLNIRLFLAGERVANPVLGEG